MFLNPVLSAFLFYYFCVVDFQNNLDAIYNVIVSGITITFVVLVFYVETWLFTAIVQIPLFAVLLWRQSSTLQFNDKTANLVFRCLFLIIMYAVVAWRIDRQNKLAFLGR